MSGVTASLSLADRNTIQRDLMGSYPDTRAMTPADVFNFVMNNRALLYKLDSVKKVLQLRHAKKLPLDGSDGGGLTYTYKELSTAHLGDFLASVTKHTQVQDKACRAAAVLLYDYLCREVIAGN